MRTGIDHLVYGVAELEPALDLLEQRWGVRASIGGQHLGRGTHNALLALGPSAYLEILAPDPRQPSPPRPRWMGIDAVGSPRLLAWAVHGSNLAGWVESAAARGVLLGAVLEGKRKLDRERELRWQLTDPECVLGDRLVPFFIDWHDSPHPAESAPRGVELLALRAEHPEPRSVLSLLRGLGVELDVSRGPVSRLIAILATPNGEVELR